MEAHANVGFLAALDSSDKTKNAEWVGQSEYSCSNEKNTFELSKLNYFVLFLNGADPGDENNTNDSKKAAKPLCFTQFCVMQGCR